jgi:excinuclease ABC subunit C
MDLHQKIRTLPTGPGCYLYKNAEGEVIYVGKAKNLRSRVRSYFLAASQANAKTGSLMREAVDIDYITVDNEREALALENNLIKQRKPRFNILLRDDKTYPYIKLTLGDRHPKVFVTRRLRKDGSAYFGPYFPGNLAHRLADVVRKSFLIPGCKVDLERYHPRPCLQYYIKRCTGPCVEGLVSQPDYRAIIRDAQLFLEGKTDELESRLMERMEAAAENMQFELAARLRDQLGTVHQAGERQRIATTDNDDADVFGFHFENDMLAVNLFHMRGGKIVDRRDMFWEDLPDFEQDTTVSTAEERENETDIEADPFLDPNPAVPAPGIVEDFDAQPESQQHSVLTSPFEQPTDCIDTSQPRSEPVISTGGEAAVERSAVVASTTAPDIPCFSPAAFFSALLKQLYLDQNYVPKHIYVPVDFPDRAVLADLLRERSGGKIEIAAPQRGDKRSLVDLVCQNAKQSYDQRFRVLQPTAKAMAEALGDALNLPEAPARIECFDISHIQGAETVASMVVWEKGAMKKADYRKFQVKTVTGVDDFASMREIVTRRYKKFSRTGEEQPASGTQPTGKDSTLPSLVLIDGGLGQLHAAAEALNELGLTTLPLASIAKREEIIYVHGQEDDPVVLDRRSPVLHVIQKIRDESHRFAIGYHRKRREMRDRVSELDDIPGVGPTTRQRLLAHFGSVRALKQAAEKNPDSLRAVVNQATAEKIRRFFAGEGTAEAPDGNKPDVLLSTLTRSPTSAA